MGILEMNLNKGCIEIVMPEEKTQAAERMNLNKGCIEIQRTM